MSDNFFLDGKITIESRDHALEYEPGSIRLSTVFLRIKDENKVVPIFRNQIDDVIEMLQRGKRTIEAFEGLNT